MTTKMDDKVNNQAWTNLNNKHNTYSVELWATVNKCSDQIFISKVTNQHNDHYRTVQLLYKIYGTQ